MAVYTSAALRPRRVSLAALAATLGPLGLLLLARTDTEMSTVVSNAVSLCAAWALGDGARLRAESAARMRDEAARRAVADERLRIARELHDVVAHTLGVVAVHAGAGRLVAASEPAKAADALDTIETTTRSALAEMRKMLGVLRDEDEDLALDPAPGLAALPGLVRQMRDAGVPVEFAVEGEQRPLAPGLEVSAYRIVQEALTNVLRHAGRAVARVRICYGAERLDVEVTDDGDGGGPVPGAGHGLLGMRERASLYGGSLTAGPMPGGGFRVSASLPVRDER